MTRGQKGSALLELGATRRPACARPTIRLHQHGVLPHGGVRRRDDVLRRPPGFHRARRCGGIAATPSLRHLVSSSFRGRVVSHAGDVQPRRHPRFSRKSASLRESRRPRGANGTPHLGRPRDSGYSFRKQRRFGCGVALSHPRRPHPARPAAAHPQLIDFAHLGLGNPIALGSRMREKVQMRGGARRPHARRTPCTLSVRPRGANEADGPFPASCWCGALTEEQRPLVATPTEGGT